MKVTKVLRPGCPFNLVHVQHHHRTRQWLEGLTADKRKMMVTAATSEIEAPANVASVRSLHAIK